MNKNYVFVPVEESKGDQHRHSLYDLIGKMLKKVGKKKEDLKDSLKEGDEKGQSLYDHTEELSKKREERIALTEVIQQLTALVPTNRKILCLFNMIGVMTINCR